MLKLYGSWFSPFARKVALGLELKNLPFEDVEGLSCDHIQELRDMNPRGEVPCLVDDDTIVCNSADILLYLDRKYPERPLYPVSAEDFARARYLERLADTTVDAILMDASLWTWSEREDDPPEGLFEQAQADLNQIFDSLEPCLPPVTASPGAGWMFDTIAIVEIAWFPHLTAVAPLGFYLDPGRFPRLARWYARMREDALFRRDRKRAAVFMDKMAISPKFERRKLAWRGDRLEWLLARGYGDWLANRIRQDRVIWPV